ncbi:MAG: hypothetical protein U0457_11995 [Candidatus Sericytochromatia bacterium]
MKKILFVLFFLYNCNFYDQYKLKNIEYIKEVPTNIFIDSVNNGVLSYEEKSAFLSPIKNKKISQLNLTNEIINYNNYIVDEKGNGIYIYKNEEASNISELKTVPILPNRKYEFKIAKIKNNNKSIFETEESFFETEVRHFNFLNLENDNKCIFYNDIYGNFNIKILDNASIKSYKILENFSYSSSKIDLNIDKYGNGWKCISFSTGILYNKLEHFKKSESFFNELMESKNLLINFINNLDKNGNGFIILGYDENGIKNIYKYDIENFAIKNKIKLFNEEDKYNRIENFFVNKSGNGIILMLKESSKNFSNIGYPFFKQIKNFKLINNETKLSNFYSVYNNYSINESGNGLVIIDTKDDVNFFNINNKENIINQRFVVRKINNYELQN